MATSDFTKLTAKKRLYMQQLPDVVAGKITKRQAARNAGFADTSAIVRIESQNLRAQFSKLMRQYVPAHKIAQRIAEGLDAEETKFFQFEGRVSDQRNVVNLSERRQYAKLAAEMTDYVESGTAQSAVGISVDVRFVGEKKE
jgi:hypothetical protein